MSRKFDASKSAPYSRLVLHLQRLWDYECCEEAQLKTWLAHHLLARENTGVLAVMEQYCSRSDFSTALHSS